MGRVEGYLVNKYGPNWKEVLGSEKRARDKKEIARDIQYLRHPEDLVTYEDFDSLYYRLECCVLKKIQECHFCLSDFGATEEEVSTWKRRLRYYEVRNALRKLRDPEWPSDSSSYWMAPVWADEFKKTFDPEYGEFRIKEFGLSAEHLEETLRENCLRAARIYYKEAADSARRGTDDGKYDFAKMRSCLNRARKGLSDIGTTCEEIIKHVKHDFPRGAARHTLDGIRWNTRDMRISQRFDFSDPRFNLKKARDILAKVGADISEIGTTREEEERLVNEVLLERAKYQLSRMRETARENQYKPGTMQMVQGDIMGGMTFFRMDLSRIPLAEQHQMHKKARKEYDYKTEIRSILRILVRAGKQLEDLGGSVVELQELIRVFRTA